MENEINLTRKELLKIIKEKKQLGSGVDGVVYGIDSKTAYKFYHNTSDNIVIEGKGIYDKDGVNIRDTRELNHIGKRINGKPINYLDNDGVILSREEAIKKAIEKQKYIKHTNLPQKLIKVNDKLVGCEYKRYNSVLGIYAISTLPVNTRKKVLIKLFNKLKELYDYNIYPLTLAQKNDLFPYSKKDANVLLGYNLEPYLIDLDGISAFYSDIFCKSKYEKSLESFSILVMETITGIDFQCLESDLETDIFIEELVNKGIPEKTAIDFYQEYGFHDEQRILNLLK